jgi:four helix bundle protein
LGTFKTFEEIKAWQKAKEMTVLLYKETAEGDIKKDFDLVRQMRRAAISITSNIAEGFERQTQKEFIQFLFIAKGSVGELRSQLTIAKELDLLNGEVVETLQNECLNISKMIGNLIKYLKENNTK